MLLWLKEIDNYKSLEHYTKYETLKPIRDENWKVHYDNYSIELIETNKNKSISALIIPLHKKAIIGIKTNSLPNTNIAKKILKNTSFQIDLKDIKIAKNVFLSIVDNSKNIIQVKFETDEPLVEEIEITGYDLNRSDLSQEMRDSPKINSIIFILKEFPQYAITLTNYGKISIIPDPDPKDEESIIKILFR